MQSIIMLISSSFKHDDAQCSHANAQSSRAWIKPWLFLVSISVIILVINVLYSNNLMEIKVFLKNELGLFHGLWDTDHCVIFLPLINTENLSSSILMKELHQFVQVLCFIGERFFTTFRMTALFVKIP